MGHLFGHLCIDNWINIWKRHLVRVSIVHPYATQSCCPNSSFYLQTCLYVICCIHCLSVTYIILTDTVMWDWEQWSHGIKCKNKTVKSPVSTFRTDWESSTCVLESVWMCAIHRQPAGVKRSGISLATCVTGICGWTVLCIAFQVWGQSRFLMTVVWRTLWNTRALQIHVPAGRDMGGARCLFQCRYSENISWGQITVMILKDFCFSARPSCCLMQSSHATPLACTLIFPKSRLQYCVC